MATRKQANKTWEELESIRLDLTNNLFPEIKQIKTELDGYRKEFLIDSEENPSVQTKIKNLEDKIVQLKSQADEKVSQILALHKEVFEDSEEKESIKKRFESFLSNSQNIFSKTEEKKEEFDTFYDKVFGVKDESGESQGGLETELEKYKNKYEKLFENIEHLLPGAVSAGLAKVFKDKVIEYARAEKTWTVAFLAVAVALSIYYGNLVIQTLPSTTFAHSFLTLFHKTPFLVFAVWVLIFIGNRRAESKKLEESYKHKEVMACAYVGYKEHIETLEETEDKALLKKHMENLLKAIKVNSGDFLSSEGDKHPFWDRFTNNKRIDKNINNSENEN